ncbi:hypothetical protein BSL78_14842 [Apostichopus japonicus]|uniref:Apextrin C-terminal domain-containing protein n=1 Tax=Stichopus japonicus TaxID=307972 RepID=A0A2G8KJX3_STIJA|nr:hypothetical protein BSL78_14842 [Apostichopus japonicus]
MSSIGISLGRSLEGFKTGYIKWDDEDGNNGNSYSGTLPDGTYDQDTVIFFCCRNDGPTYRPIPLPTDDPFVLFPTDEECQEVQGMTSELQWYKWDTENRGNADKFVGSLPFHRGNPDIQLAFCVYTKQSV